MGGRLRTFPTSGEEAVAGAINAVGKSVDTLRRQQMRMPQRGYVETAAVQTVPDSGTTVLANTELDITVPRVDSQLRVYVELFVEEVIATGFEPQVNLREDGVKIGPLMIPDGLAMGSGGNTVATGQGYNPGAVAGMGGLWNGGFYYALPPWGHAKQHQPSSTGTHTYDLSVEPVNIDSGAMPASVGNAFEFSNIKMWLEVL